MSNLSTSLPMISQSQLAEHQVGREGQEDFEKWTDDKMTIIMLPLAGGILLVVSCFACICYHRQ